ncbi:hypothetical protein E2C01_055280 [Portunus trituberculatus]|uniref:Uncharacterized protein n=1 Tax=Portunus trituberculatus TaxID=210409 RepID=A0A5B7GX76_PORTR|nr:hypothetical protein [Portunus trituberculatus]
MRCKRKTEEREAESTEEKTRDNSKTELSDQRRVKMGAPLISRPVLLDFILKGVYCISASGYKTDAFSQKSEFGSMISAWESFHRAGNFGILDQVTDSLFKDWNAKTLLAYGRY